MKITKKTASRSVDSLSRNWMEKQILNSRSTKLEKRLWAHCACEWGAQWARSQALAGPKSAARL